MSDIMKNISSGHTSVASMASYDFASLYPGVMTSFTIDDIRAILRKKAIKKIFPNENSN